MWQVPTLQMGHGSEHGRKVTWLELFYDLVFVVVVSELAHKLVGIDSPRALLPYALLFAPVWWLWLGTTFYTERFETDGLENRLIYFCKMIPLVGFAVFAHNGVGEGSTGFAVSYVIARTFLTLLWVRASVHVPAFRPTGRIFTVGFTFSIMLFFASIFVDAPFKFALWIVAVISDQVTPWFTLKHQAKLPRFSVARLPERLGLFVIVVLGESVVAVVRGVAEIDQPTLQTALRSVLGLAIGFAMWSVYFDFIGRRGPRPNVLSTICWTNLHFPMVLSIAAAGPGILAVISGHGASWLLSAAVSGALSTMGLVELTLNRPADEPTNLVVSSTLKLLAGATSALFAVLGAAHGVAALTVPLALLLLQMVYGAWIWFRHEAPAPAHGA
jgi:low temperature requirement protein LtrA